MWTTQRGRLCKTGVDKDFETMGLCSLIRERSLEHYDRCYFVLEIQSNDARKGFSLLTIARQPEVALLIIQMP